MLFAEHLPGNVHKELNTNDMCASDCKHKIFFYFVVYATLDAYAFC